MSLSSGSHAPLSSSQTFSVSSSFLLESDEIEKVEKKKGLKSKFIFAFLLKFFQITGRFPRQDDSFLDLPLQELAHQLGCEAFDHQSFLQTFCSQNHRTLKRFRHEIRQHFFFRDLLLTGYNVLFFPKVFPGIRFWKKLIPILGNEKLSLFLDKNWTGF
jgi:hypothetical protein